MAWEPRLTWEKPREKPPIAVPGQAMEQFLALVETAAGPRLAIIWSQEQLRELQTAGKIKLLVGVGWVLPEQHTQSVIYLGGDYPGWIEHLHAFSRVWPGEAAHMSWPGIQVGFAPNHPDEPYGMLGWRLPQMYRYRLSLYASKQQARELLAQFLREDSASEAIREVEQQLPYIEEQCLLPETCETPVLPLGNYTAAWVCWWQGLYVRTTRDIK